MTTALGQRPSPAAGLPAADSTSFRVLLVGHFDRLANRLDRSQWYRYEALARQPGVTLFGPGIEGYRPGMSAAQAVARALEGRWPDLILHGMDFKESGIPLLEGLAEAPALTAIELQDSWAVPEQQVAFINRQRFDVGLLIVRHHLPRYAASCPNTQFLWVPHAVNTSLFHDYGLAKDCDVLLYGNVASHTYPLRARLAHLLPRSGLQYRHINHPGYYPTGGLEGAGVVTGEALSRAINRAWITISTSSIYRCLMMKYFEIAASRSLIAGDMPEEGREIFGNDFLELSPAQTDAQLTEALRGALADQPRLRAQTDAAHQRVLADHNTDAFAIRLLRQFREIAAERKARALSLGG